MLTMFRGFALVTTLLVLQSPILSCQVDGSQAVVQSAPTGPVENVPNALDLLYLLPVAFGITIRKSAQDISGKFVQRAAAAGKDYVDGVKQAGQEWEQNAKAAEQAYEQGVQEAMGRKAFGAGISNAGAAKYQANAEKLGGQRYAPGVQNSQDAYVRGVGKYLDVLRNLTLPPKGPRRSPQNQARANAVALALGNAKVGK